MKIKNIEINGFAALAPMAGVADRAMREICVKYGAGFTVGELTSSKGVSLGDKKSFKLLACSDMERPMASQLFGCDPETMAIAAQKALDFKPDFIDINMGCPAPKVAGNGGGSALMRDPILAERIVKAVVDAVPIPVTVKIRTGWDSDNLTAVELAKRCENAGASMLTVHGRTRQQFYSGNADWNIIKEVKKSVKIPVIGNGDITDIESAKRMLEYTKCDAIMIGRGALGNPWLIKQLVEFTTNNKIIDKPTYKERIDMCFKHLDYLLELKNEKVSILEMRSHISWYIKGMPNAAYYKNQIFKATKKEKLQDILKNYLKELDNNQ